MIVLKVKNLRLKYPNGDRKIFDNLNIEIKDKEKVLLLGPSGSGKSTLLNVLSGIALIAEFAAGAGETIVMGKFDIPTIVYAILQGLACEVVFAIFKYKSRSLMVAMLAGLVTALVSFPVDYFYGYLNEVAGWNLLLFIIFRAISGIVLSGILSYLIVKALDQTGVTKLFRPASQKDYDNL